MHLAVPTFRRVPTQCQLPPEDALLSAGEACALVHVSRSRWDAYAKRFRALTRGRRVVQANPSGRGVYRWLKSAVIEHMHVELANDRDPTSDLVEATEVEGDDAVASSEQEAT